MTPADLIERLGWNAECPYCEKQFGIDVCGEAASTLTAQAERIASLEKMLADESRDARSIAHTLEVACGLLDEAVRLFRESLDEGGVDVGFDERLAELLMSSGLIAGITPTSTRKRSAQATRDFAFSKRDGGDAG